MKTFSVASACLGIIVDPFRWNWVPHFNADTQALSDDKGNDVAQKQFIEFGWLFLLLTLEYGDALDFSDDEDEGGGPPPRMKPA